jgi:hypothetical protein
MPKYQASIRHIVTSIATIEFDAPNKDAADELADLACQHFDADSTIFQSSKVEWELDEETYDVDSVEEI